MNAGGGDFKREVEDPIKALGKELVSQDALKAIVKSYSSQTVYDGLGKAIRTGQF